MCSPPSGSLTNARTPWTGCWHGWQRASACTTCAAGSITGNTADCCTSLMCWSGKVMDANSHQALKARANPYEVLPGLGERSSVLEGLRQVVARAFSPGRVGRMMAAAKRRDGPAPLQDRQRLDDCGSMR